MKDKYYQKKKNFLEELEINYHLEFMVEIGMIFQMLWKIIIMKKQEKFVEK